MRLCSKQPSLFSFYALPSGGKSKGAVVHLIVLPIWLLCKWSRYHFINNISWQITWHYYNRMRPCEGVIKNQTHAYEANLTNSGPPLGPNKQLSFIVFHQTKDFLSNLKKKTFLMIPCKETKKRTFKCCDT